MGTLIVSHEKDYAVPKYEEMYDKIITKQRTEHQVDHIALTDDNQTRIPSINRTFENHGRTWASAICYEGKTFLNKKCIEEGYDYVLYQGVDCFYNSLEDFEKLIQFTCQYKYDICGGLVAGRNREDYPVCRQWIIEDDQLTKRQGEMISFIDGAIESGLQGIVVGGYVGSDAVLISRRVLELVDWSDYIDWHIQYDYGRNDPYAICSDEWIMYKANKLGIPSISKVDVRPWHAHETGRTVRYPGEVIDISELTWD